MVSVKAVVQVHLFVLLALQNITAAVTAVVVELSTTILSVRFMLELLVMVFTHTLAVRILTLQLRQRIHAFKQMLTTYTTRVFSLENVTLKEAALFV
jgi:hypothetical protein